MTPPKIYSGASPEKVRADLRPLVDFQDAGVDLSALEDLIEERLVPHLMRYDHPGFLSMFNIRPEAGASLGAEVALAHNQGVTNWQVSPGGAVLEELCGLSLCRLFGLPPGADAAFMYCGTYANQEAIYLALHRKAELLGFDLAQKGLTGFPAPERLRIIASREAHFSINQAVRQIGLGEESLVLVGVDDNRRLSIPGLKKELAALRETADVFCVVATAGTTSTGSVDPLRAVSQAIEDQDIWFHIDGAYGLAYALVQEWRPLFEGLDRADSITWDPHKQMGVPIPCSILFARRAEDFHRVSLYGDYFNRMEDDKPNPGLKSPPSTRPLSALSLAASIKHQGLRALRDRLRAPLTAIKTAAELLASDSDIELGHRPETGILCFRLLAADLPEKELDALQQHIYREILAGGERTIALTRLGTKRYLRLVAVSPDVSAEHLLETASETKALAQAYLSRIGCDPGVFRSNNRYNRD